MDFRKFLTCIITTIFLCSCATHSSQKQVKYTPNTNAIPPNSKLNLKLPSSSNVTFRGEVNFDSAGTGTGGMLYPAPNAAGFLVAIATHAALVNSMNGSQKNSIQEKADAVLTPYKAFIGSFSYRELVESGLKNLEQNEGTLIVSIDNDDDQLWAIESLPVFILSQNKDSLMLQNTIAVYPVDKPSMVIYKNMISVLSAPTTTDNFEQYWAMDDHEQLRNTSTDLFSISLKIALQELRKDSAINENAFKTFRYQAGKAEKIERGQLIDSTCNRITIRNLRGWIMSVPITDAADCVSKT